MAGWLRKLWNREKEGPCCAAVVAAAGSSSRMGGENKLLMDLGGVPVLVRSILALDRSPSIGEIVVAAREEDLLTVADLCKAYGISRPLKIVKGGATRTESVLAACLECGEEYPLIAVHDGARPLVTTEVIERAVARAAQCAAAAPAVEVKDTIKVAEGDLVRSTPDRRTLRAVQTPQVFDAQLLKAALQSALEAGAEITDDCSAVERLGKEIALTEGDEGNLKITTPIDLLLAEAILEERGDMLG